MTDIPTEELDNDGEPDGVTMVEIQEEMESSFLDYAMSVIISRALPDARDGLKPVHRRILWSMYDQGFRPDRNHVKCARVTGDVMARFHPHGDSAIYDALARMAQPFSLRHPLIDFHGNYGSPEDPPAAARYTECKLDQLAMQMLADIDENTVDFIDNYSGDFTEPAVLPARFPNLLVNGSQGIAVGMATNIPPHNLYEVCDAVTHLLGHPDATIDDLMEFVRGPDFPTGGQILGRVGIESAYRTGRGSVKMRANTELRENGQRQEIVVTAFPYQISAGAVARKIVDLVRNNEIDGISNVNDESSGDETRFVITLKRDANPEVVLNNLWKSTPLQSSFGVNMVALVGGVPRTLNLRDALVAYVDHQIEVITRRSEYRLDQAQKRLHIVEGLMKALDLIDEIIATIRASEDRGAARTALMDGILPGVGGDVVSFSEVQANHILDMQLGRLTRLGRTDLETEAGELRLIIEGLEEILGDDTKLRAVIVEELAVVREKFGEERRSSLEIDPGEFDIEDLIDDDPLVFTMSASGYVKTTPAEEFRAQGRGGRGIAGAKLKDEDTLTHLIQTSAHSYLLFFSTRGRVYRLKAHEIPVASRTARGTAIVNLLPLQEGETIQAIIDTRDYETNRFLFFATAKGRVKKTRFNAYDSSLRAGLIAIKLNDDDELVEVIPTNGVFDILLSSRFGQTIRFKEDQVREMGRNAAGVLGLKFKKSGDVLVACDIALDGATLLHITERGYGKRTSVDDYPLKGRGGMGVIGIKILAEKGPVVGTLMVEDDDEILAVTRNGVLIRTRVEDISMQGRSASGVKIMTPDGDDVVASIALVNPDPEAVEIEIVDGDDIDPESEGTN
ncbi:MAG: DNA gyrase subunit A [Acidimicrobiaceae bacterium]|nr:DNA gyrase subunit A [Acidimicrobiaceae bacterium]MBT5850985.1 DNA gyrase subunit A [Acidimicrobiaceae bacterium]